jgi:hypothetical protein
MANSSPPSMARHRRLPRVRHGEGRAPAPGAVLPHVRRGPGPVPQGARRGRAASYPARTTHATLTPRSCCPQASTSRSSASGSGTPRPWSP